MWPQWQGQHHGPASGEQHVQPPQPSQPEVFSVRLGFLNPPSEGWEGGGLILWELMGFGAHVRAAG